jgi:MerR family transcriptional regulator/heat shock protein HspR
MKNKEPLEDRPLYLISIVSELLDVHPQTLRMYEKEGFVSPNRSGGQRIYSQADVERLRLVLELTRNMGVNRAGVDIILRMRQRMESLQGEMEHMMDYLETDTRQSFQTKIEEIFNSDD